MTDSTVEQDYVSDKGAMIVTVVALAIVLAIVAALYLLARVVNPNVYDESTLKQATVAENLRSVTGFAQGASSSGPKTGEEVFNGLCTACHTAGAAGAPKFGDAAAWAPRIAQGADTLFKHALGGYKGMPAKGGGNNSDLEVERAVVYMANKGGAKFPEPKDPAADADAGKGAAKADAATAAKPDAKAADTAKK